MKSLCVAGVLFICRKPIRLKNSIYTLGITIEYKIWLCYNRHTL